MKNILVWLCLILVISCKTEKTEVVTESKDLAEATTPLEKKKSKVFTDFIYDVGNRFTAIKKADLDKLTAFSDIIGKEHENRVVEYKSISVKMMLDDKPSDIGVPGTSGTFNAKQLDFLHNLDYSANIVIWADYLCKNKDTGALEDTHWTPHFSVVPEKQAEYLEGKDALKKFLRDSSLEARADVDPEKLKPAKLYFTVTKDGNIKNIKLDRSSNYPEVDKKMIELIQNTSENWIPAENIKGEKVDQELVVSFGLLGC